MVSWTSRTKKKESFISLTEIDFRVGQTPKSQKYEGIGDGWGPGVAVTIWEIYTRGRLKPGPYTGASKIDMERLQGQRVPRSLPHEKTVYCFLDRIVKPLIVVNF